MSTEPADLIARAPEPPPAEPAPVSATDVAKVLVVEDEACAAFLYKTMLQREGYQVQHCPDGDAALQILASERFDAVVLDLMMPKTDGMQVLKAMRALPEHLLTPVIIVTSARLKLVEDAAAQFGARFYLEKTQHRELMAAVRQIAAERASLKTSRLRMAPAQSVPEPSAAYYRPRVVTETRASGEEPRGLARLFRLKSASK